MISNMKMKSSSECTKTIGSSEKIVFTLKNLLSDEAENEKIRNLKIVAPNKSNEVKSISQYKSLSSINTSCVFAEIKLPSSINILIDDSLLKTNGFVENQKNVEKALKDCLISTSHKESPLDNICEDEDHIKELHQINSHSKLYNHKRKIFSSIHDHNSSYSFDTKINHSYLNKTKEIDIKEPSTNNKIWTVNPISNVLSPKSRSHQEIAVGIPNFFFDKSSIIEQSKITYECFLQNYICLNLPSTIGRCIECNAYQIKTNLTKQDYDNISCRFYAFRLLRFTKSGTLVVAGYPNPFKANNIDLGIWLPNKFSCISNNFNIEMSKKILEDIGGQLCKFFQIEKQALSLKLSNDQQQILWKKCVNGIRELCDVCKTSIFNYHWSCGKCGFMVCVDCYLTKFGNNYLSTTSYIKQDQKIWLLCSNYKSHQIDQLAITQIMAGDSLNIISKTMHEVCKIHNIPLDCNCDSKCVIQDRALPDIQHSVADQFFHEDLNDNYNHDKDEKTSDLNILLSKKLNEHLKKTKNKMKSLNHKIIATSNFQNKENFKLCWRNQKIWAPHLSLMVENHLDAPHMWLCEGYLLRLLDPKCNANYELFQNQWKHGQPVLVSYVGNSLKSSLWHPESFSHDFGDQKNDLINCVTGKVISNEPMSKFWDGFVNAAERLCDSNGDPMLLKLKDWPPSADFADTLPDRFQDLMNCLPLKEYTQRNGRYNLVSHLPECFVKPDLGPKMYTAYGNVDPKNNKIGTTNLHLDMSDAVNVMVYVGITKNCQKFNFDWYTNNALQIIEEAGCDEITKRRYYNHREIPGAVWHIYHPTHADSIRDLLIKVSVEQGHQMEAFMDPIHDQTYYLDEHLRERLFKEYGIKGYTIVQFYGDAIFIPAGAPHQVKNLHNCIKVAEDFVSPENVHYSFRMTEEFRYLTDSHTNHEDKLQIKNIVFHSVKKSISILMQQSR